MRNLYDEEGNAVEGIPDETELKELQDTKAKVADLEAKAKKADEYENDPAYKNFGLLRKKAEDAEKEKDELRKQVEELSPKNKPQQFSKEEVEKTASEMAEKKYQEKYINNVLSQFGEKKEVVKAYFDKLAVGETLTEEKIAELAQASANAVGLNRIVNPIRQVIASQVGGAPVFDEEAKSFADSDEGKMRAEAMGLKFTVKK